MASLGRAVDDLGQVGQVVGDVLAERIGKVLLQTLNGGGAGDQGLDSEANEGNLQKI